jgi:hypothetical protein
VQCIWTHIRIDGASDVPVVHYRLLLLLLLLLEVEARANSKSSNLP